MEDYVLKWSEHHSHMSSQYQSFRSRETYSDVAFYCENQLIRAHKLVLAAGSSYFDRLFTAVHGNNANPVLILRDTRRDLLLLAINFMYEGEARVPSCDLAAFMALADSLEIKGLRVEEKPSNGDNFRNIGAFPTRPRGRPRLPKRPLFGSYENIGIPPCPPLAKRMFSEALAGVNLVGDQHVFPGSSPPDEPPTEPIDATTSNRDASDEDGGEKRGNVSDGDSGTAGSLTGNRHEAESDESTDEKSQVVVNPCENLGSAPPTVSAQYGIFNMEKFDAETYEEDEPREAAFPSADGEFDGLDLQREDVSPNDFGMLTDDASHSSAFPKRAPDDVDQNLQMSRVSECMWRGKTLDTGRVLYFCELCLYSSGHKGNAMKHNHYRAKKIVPKAEGLDLSDRSGKALFGPMACN